LDRTVRRLLLLVPLLAFAALPSLAEARAVPAGFYGTMYDGTLSNAPAAIQGPEMDRMARSGVESIRTTFSWPEAQPERNGSIHFGSADALVAQAAMHNMRLLPVVVYTPRWAAANHRPAAPPRRTIDYTRYLRALVKRYGPSGSFWTEHPGLPRKPIREWQIWNEPQRPDYWNVRRGPNGWVRGYGRLLRASYKAIKRQDPRGRVILAGLASASWRFLDYLYRKAGIKGYFDAAAVHPYTRTPEGALEIVRLFRRTMRRAGDRRKRVYVTEITWAAAKGRTRTRRKDRFFVTTDRGMASRVRRSYRLFARHWRSLHVTRVYWYTWATSYKSRGGRYDFFNFSGLVRWNGQSSRGRPALGAYRSSARRYEGCAKTAAGVCTR